MFRIRFGIGFGVFESGLSRIVIIASGIFGIEFMLVSIVVVDTIGAAVVVVILS